MIIDIHIEYGLFLQFGSPNISVSFTFHKIDFKCLHKISSYTNHFFVTLVFILFQDASFTLPFTQFCFSLFILKTVNFFSNKHIKIFTYYHS